MAANTATTISRFNGGLFKAIDPPLFGTLFERGLDPACGSGNILYLALKALRDIEKRAPVDAQALGLGAEVSMQTGPHNILGLEINEFAAELARVTVWIGDIQWRRRNGYPHAINPILKPLDGIEHCDALLTLSPIPTPALEGEVMNQWFPKLPC